MLWRALALAVLLLTAADLRAQTPDARDGNPSHQKRVALVIGNSRYQHIADLANPRNDAALIATTLTALGFELVGSRALIDLDRQAFENAIRSFGRQIGGADVALFYYAGHGLQVRGTNWLVPVSANPAGVADLDYEMIDANLVIRQMQEARTHLNVIILDACRNNPFGALGLRSAAAGLAQMTAPEGTLISYATQPGNVARDGDDGHSPYSAALAQDMRKPGLDIFQLFNAVGLEVKRATGGEQQPWVSSSPLDGDFSFVALPGQDANPPPAAAPGFDPRQVEIAYWESIKESKDPSDFQAYLDRYPSGSFAELARHRIAALKPASAGKEDAKLAPPAGGDVRPPVDMPANKPAARAKAEAQAAAEAEAEAKKKDAPPSASPSSGRNDARCTAILESTQLGEGLSDENRAYLVAHCH